MIIYINGIKTSKGEAESQREYLQDIMSDKVWLCYNKTYGFGLDLVESFYNRAVSWGPDLPITEDLKRMMVKAHDQGYNDIHIIAHSQGTAIAANALSNLPDFWRTAPKITATFFANVNSTEPEDIEGEIFLNDEDGVSTNLFISGLFLKIKHAFKRPQWNWKKYTRRGRGHSFIDKYLEKLPEFTGYKESMFYSRIKSNDRCKECGK